MEWVELTGRTVEEAKDAALDQLGVDTEDAEFEILEEPTRGLFGKTRGQARVRARIRPTRPRPKVERRDKRRRNGRPRREGEASASSASEGEAGGETSSRSGSSGRRRAGGNSGNSRESRQDRSNASADGSRGGSRSASKPKGAETMNEPEIDLATHGAIVEEFVTGLVAAFGLSGRVESEEIDDETREVRVEGAELGVMVGPKGATLSAIQELSRSVIHRRVTGTAAGRVRLDVAGYRQRRREALERFARTVAEDVRTSGVQKALEPMSAPDRKIVHDAVNELDGVSTLSEGDEPRRRVVIIPA